MKFLTRQESKIKSKNLVTLDVNGKFADEKIVCEERSDIEGLFVINVAKKLI